MHVKPITAQEKFNFPRANAILARAQALLWVRDWGVVGKIEGGHVKFILSYGGICFFWSLVGGGVEK
jgi:hypothetical protein